MGSTIITVIIAVLLLFLQIYSEKRKKEAKREAALKRDGLTAEKESGSYNNSSPYDFIYGPSVEEREISTEKVSVPQKPPFFEEEPEESVAETSRDNAIETLPSLEEGEEFLSPDFIESEPEASDQVEIDPRMLIIYPEILRPKFME
jgi:hypothetical protein